MRKRTVVKCISAGLILCLGVRFMAVGRNKAADYSMGEAEDVRGRGRMDLKKFENTPLWQEVWTAENTKGNTVKLRVDAKISVPDAEQMSVVEVTETAFDASYKEKIAGQIFGDTEIYHNDHASLAEREPEGAEDAYTPVTAYDADEYLGERDGIFYELSFSEYVGGDSGCRNKIIRFSPKDVYQVCPEELRGKEGVDYVSGEDDAYDESAENQCMFSEVEALVTAWNFVEKLGLDYSVFRSSSPLFWRSGTSEEKDRGGYEMADGYMFTFDAGIDQISFALFGDQERYENYSKKKEEEKGRYSLCATLNVTVTDRGVIEMSAENPIEVTRVTEGVELLPIDAVKGIIKEQIAGHFEDFRFDYASMDGKVIFNKMELIYFRLRNRESQGDFSYVPAWRLSEYYSFGEKRISSPVFINAIDGSVIDFYDEV